jgi:hypothetical protein
MIKFGAKIARNSATTVHGLASLLWILVQNSDERTVKFDQV